MRGGLALRSFAGPCRMRVPPESCRRQVFLTIFLRSIKMLKQYLNHRRTLYSLNREYRTGRYLDYYFSRVDVLAAIKSFDKPSIFETYTKVYFPDSLILALKAQNFTGCIEIGAGNGTVLAWLSQQLDIDDLEAVDLWDTTSLLAKNFFGNHTPTLTIKDAHTFLRDRKSASTSELLVVHNVLWAWPHDAVRDLLDLAIQKFTSILLCEREAFGIFRDLRDGFYSNFRYRKYFSRASSFNLKIEPLPMRSKGLPKVGINALMLATKA